jgi:hypothetical protein
MFRLYKTARRRLVQDLLFIDEEEGEDGREAVVRQASEKRSKLLYIDVTTLFNNEAEDIRGWNFLDDSRNQLALDRTQ